MAPECQEKNLKDLTMVAVGVNKSAEQYMLLDDQTRDELAAGKFRDQRRGSFGTSASAPPAPRPAPGATPAGKAAGPGRPARKSRPAARPKPVPWTGKQERLALLYNEQGLRPAEIAEKLGVSSYLVTQIILTAKNRGKL